MTPEIVSLLTQAAAVLGPLALAYAAGHWKVLQPVLNLLTPAKPAVPATPATPAVAPAVAPALPANHPDAVAAAQSFFAQLEAMIVASIARAEAKTAPAVPASPAPAVPAK